MIVFLLSTKKNTCRRHVAMYPTQFLAKMIRNFRRRQKKLRYVDDMKDKTLEKWIQFPQHPLIQLAGLLAYAF